MYPRGFWAFLFFLLVLCRGLLGEIVDLRRDGLTIRMGGGVCFLNPLGVLPWTAVRDCGIAQGCTYSALEDLQRIRMGGGVCF